MRRILAGLVVVAVMGAFALTTAASSNNSALGTYKIAFDNAFGLVTGAEFKVAGVQAGTITAIDLPPACIAGNTQACKALVTIHVTQGGFGQFHADAFCQSRPQSLIGEYFIDCQP